MRAFRGFGDEPQVLMLDEGNRPRAVPIETGEKPPQWTVIVGENGTGKTSLLQAIALSHYFVFLWSRIDKPEFQDARFRDLVLRKVFSGLGASYDRLASFARTETFGEEGKLPGITLHVERRPGTARNGEKRSEPLGFGFEFRVGKIGAISFHPESVRGPVVPCIGYGAGRRPSAVGTDVIPNADPVSSLFDDRPGLRDASDWLLRLDHARRVEGGGTNPHAQRFDQAVGILKAVLPGVEEVRPAAFGEVNPVLAVELRTPDGWLPLQHLGYGYQATAALVLDLASRMVEFYPHSRDPLAEAALVLIDEIDLHLHPLWQRRVIGDLTEHFPNVQFIATTHSPMIIQGGRDSHVAVLRREKDRVVIDNDPGALHGYSVDQLLTSDAFGLTSARPPEFEGPLERRRELLEKGRISKEERAELKRLDQFLERMPLGETAHQARVMSLAEKLVHELEKGGRSDDSDSSTARPARRVRAPRKASHRGA